MLEPVIGLYITYVTNFANGATHDAKIIGGPNVVRDHTGAKATLWTVTHEDGSTGVVPHYNIRRVSRVSHNGFGVNPLYAECTECEEEEQFFLEDDYICGYCRTNVIDP